MIDERTYLLKWIKPIFGLIDQAQWKLPLAVVSGVGIEQLEHLSNINPTYVVATVLLVGTDFVTGVIKSRSLGVRFRSIRVRSTFVKTLEYAFFLGATTVLANTFVVVAWLDDTAFFLVCLTEWVSITENFSSSSVRKIIDRLRREMRERGLAQGEGVSVETTRVTETIRLDVTAESPPEDSPEGPPEGPGGEPPTTPSGPTAGAG